jgi:thiol-disulfide isomerase/thioredoxin
MPDTAPPSRPASRRRPLVIGAVVVGAVIGYLAVSNLQTFWHTASGDPACRPAVALSKKLAPLARGEVAALSMATAPLQIPDLAFKDADGQPKTLSDWRGKTVLLNLWATWCVPCRKEMPALNALQAKLGSPDFEVVAVNIDTRDPAKPKAFLTDGNLTTLGYFTDSSAKVFQDLKAVGRALGMPTSVLLDGKGCEIATIAGPAEWDSEDAVKLIKAAVKPTAASF